MRRALVEEPMARAAVWSPRLALFALALACLAVAASRFAGLDAASALSVFAAAGLFAGAAALTALSAFSTIWRIGATGVGRAAFGLALALGLLAFPLGFGAVAARLPALSDVSTDAADPPDFSRSARALARRGVDAPADPGAPARLAARRAYPGLAPLILDLEPEEAYRLARKVVQGKRWRIVEERPPGGRLGRAQIEAIDRSLFFGFPSDIAIRLTPLVDQTRIDMRSVQRVGRHDLGEGARRWRAFAEAMEAEAGER